MGGGEVAGNYLLPRASPDGCDDLATATATATAGTNNGERTKCMRLTCFVVGCNGEHANKSDHSAPTTPNINADGNEAEVETGYEDADITRCPKCGALQQWHYCRECDSVQCNCCTARNRIP